VIERQARTADETTALGASLAEGLLAADLPPQAPVVIYLSGDLGAGKTTFAQGFIRRCGVTDAVRSPTYALVEPYEAGHFTLLHLDLYRLRDPSEIETLGLSDWARACTVWLVEWPQRAADRLPPADLCVALDIETGWHRITLTATTAFGTNWLRRTDLA
jgi:tRNA threonylcarbamoyladenosine biosynthesis protein TsaE